MSSLEKTSRSRLAFQMTTPPPSPSSEPRPLLPLSKVEKCYLPAYFGEKKKKKNDPMQFQRIEIPAKKAELRLVVSIQPSLTRLHHHHPYTKSTRQGFCGPGVFGLIQTLDCDIAYYTAETLQMLVTNHTLMQAA